MALSAAVFSGCGSAKSTSDMDAQAGAAVQEAVSAETETVQSDTDAADLSADAEQSADDRENANVLADGTYVAEFTTDNSMFHVSDAYEEKGILTVENGEMTIHISLQSKNIVNLYPGLAEDAQKDGAELLQPTTDTVTYSDGTSKEVYGFDVPVPVIGEAFDIALIGTHGNWYDHKVVVSNPVEGDEVPAAE